MSLFSCIGETTASGVLNNDFTDVLCCFTSWDCLVECVICLLSRDLPSIFLGECSLSLNNGG